MSSFPFKGSIKLKWKNSWKKIFLYNSHPSGRRYARWHLWQDKFVYIIVFFVFIIWLEWTIHSQVFPLEVEGGSLRYDCEWCLAVGQGPTVTTTTDISSSPRSLWTEVLSPKWSSHQMWSRVRSVLSERSSWWLSCSEWRPAARREDGAPTLLTTVSVTSVFTTSGRKVLMPPSWSSSYSSLSAQKLLPTDLPLDDDNSDFSLHGYQNFLIEPKVWYQPSTPLYHLSDRLWQQQHSHHCVHCNQQLQIQVSQTPQYMNRAFLFLFLLVKI